MPVILHHQAGAESLVLGAIMGREAAMAGAVAADHRPSPFPCRKTAHHAASSTSSSARMGTASPCAGAVTLMQTAWTAPTRRTAALEVTAVLHGSLGAGCLPPHALVSPVSPLWVEALPYVCVSTALPSPRACTHTYLSPREPPAMLEIRIVAPDHCGPRPVFWQPGSTG